MFKQTHTHSVVALCNHTEMQTQIEALVLTDMRTFFHVLSKNQTMNSFTSEALRIITYVIIKQVLVGPGAGGVKYSAVFISISLIMIVSLVLTCFL